MPHLDTSRRRTWESLWSTTARINREIDAALKSEWAVPLVWFEVLDALREIGGMARPLDLAAVMGVPASTLSRRLDRLEEEGWIERHLDQIGSDLRAVEIELTKPGRRLWREMNVSYRRLVQEHFARHLTDEQMLSLRVIVDDLGPRPTSADHRASTDCQ